MDAHVKNKKKERFLFQYLSSLGETLSDSFPVDDLPDVLEIVRTNVLVLQVVGVLPDINTQKRSQCEQRILIGSGGNLNAFELLVITLIMREAISHHDINMISHTTTITYQPSPART